MTFAMDLSKLMQSQGPIDQSIAADLVAATPEACQSIRMSVQRLVAEDRESFRIEITCPDGMRELVSPTPEIFDHVKQLSDLYVGHGRPWLGVNYAVALKASGEWGYRADFTYPQGASGIGA